MLVEKVDNVAVAHGAVFLPPLVNQVRIEILHDLGHRVFAAVLIHQSLQAFSGLLVAIDKPHSLNAAQKAVDHRRRANNGTNVIAVYLLGDGGLEPGKEFLELGLGDIGIPAFALTDLLAIVLGCSA